MEPEVLAAHIAAFRRQSTLYSEGMTKDWWIGLSDDERDQIVGTGGVEGLWTPLQVEAFLKDWRIWARDQQIPPAGLWKMWVILAGRGYGKTKTAVETVNDMVQSGKKGRICLLGQGVDDVRDVMVEGNSGFLKTAPSWFRPKWSPSRGGGLLEWPNGALGYVYSAEDPEALRGPEFDLAWIDEIMAFKADARVKAESNLRFGLRLGDNPQRIYTTTPKPHKWIKDLVGKIVDEHGVQRPEALRKGLHLTRGSTYDNAENLPDSFLEGVTDDYEGTRLGRQELYGDILGDTEGALWNTSTLDKNRIMATGRVSGPVNDRKVEPDYTEEQIQDFARTMDKIIVAVDPNMTATGTSHAAGITVHGKKGDLRYLLADYSIRGASPAKWAKRVADACEDYQADEIVAEVNQGGDLVKSNIEQYGQAMGVPLPRVHKVHASRGKVIRAGPVAAAYEQGKVIHVGHPSRFEKLETQLCDLHEGLDPTGEDFDRADSVVWGQTRLGRKARYAGPGAGAGPGILTMNAFGGGD